MELSIVITYFDKGELIFRAIRSITPQLDANIEVVIVDDGSGERYPAEAVEMLLSKGVVARLIGLERNIGPGNAKNVGISSAVGEIILLLDADDEIPAGALDAIRQAFESNPGADFIFGDYVKVYESSGKYAIVNCEEIAGTDGWLDQSKLANTWILLGSSPFRKSRIWVGNRYPLASASTDDMDFWRSVLVGGARGKYMSKTIYKWNVQEESNNTGQNSRVLAQAWLRHRHFYRQNLRTGQYLSLLARSLLLGSFLGTLVLSVRRQI